LPTIVDLVLPEPAPEVNRMPEPLISLRNATSADLGPVADIFSRARRTMSFLPDLHSAEEDLAFVHDILFGQCRIRVAQREGAVVGFVAVNSGWIAQLHTDPDHFNIGIGSALVRDTQRRFDRLQLWCFQANARGCAFYEKHGFKPAEFTDGANNEEKMPDVRYRWKR
jgi:putative acetyltransferase